MDWLDDEHARRRAIRDGDDASDLRLLAWYDTLSSSERAEVDYVLNQLKGSFADSYVAVKLHRIEEKMGSSPPAWRPTIRELATLVTAVAAFFGISHVPGAVQ